MSKKPLKKINVEQVQVGMHIVALDISWLDSPFLSHSKKIKSKTDLDKLKRSGAKIITIDPNKGKDVTQQNKTKQAGQKNKEEKPTKNATEEKNPNKAEIEKLKPSVGEELSVAKNIKTKLVKAVEELHHDLAQNKSISTEKITPLIDQTLESLERNNQALMTLAHLSKRSQKIIDHTFSTFCITLNMAQFQNLSEEEKNYLAQAAILHDSGWNSIPLNLMGKRKNYTNSELKLIHKHTALGIKKLADSDLPETTIRIVAEHHEREDGSGYPNNLKQKDIHPLSKLLAVADTYDEMVHQLRDKPGMLPTNALRQLYTEAENGIFNQGSVATLIALLGIYPVTTPVELSNGEKGVIHEVPTDKHLTPSVKIIYDSNGNLKTTPEVVDLSTVEENIDIKKVLNPENAQDDPFHKLISA